MRISSVMYLRSVSTCSQHGSIPLAVVQRVSVMRFKCKVMIHQPSGGVRDRTEIQIAAENILKTKKKLNEMLAANTGKPYEVVAADTERDYYMSAEEAKEYGLTDEVIVRKTTSDDK